MGSSAKDRYASLECLAKLATIPYERIHKHPYRDAVLRKVLLVLDDRKCPRVPDDVKANFATAGSKFSAKVKSVAKTDLLFKIHQQLYVQILDLPGTECLRDLRTAHLNFLIKVSGLVTPRRPCFRSSSS
ncbi:hypothetical protein PsorP6_006301 [Peronosclerospora sorghi]|uniref:Uncharacterized protein n=1 Tax=Peronosclerospora sorghi TaxID=230839 RepID=A0ACC0W3D2_9STRA|nr:hypothetical protein PsorP6_006301 [Peronosclerospora sorghi]